MINILYAGSPDVSAIPLERLIAESVTPGAQFRIAGVLTNPPAAQGRSKALVPTPVAQEAERAESRYGITVPVFTPEKLGAQAREQIAAVHPDLLVCFAYGKIFGPKFMALFPYGGINLHPSLLPAYRGCAPVPAAILDCKAETGITVQKLAAQMDSGNILLQRIIPLSGTETAGALLESAARAGAEMLLEIITGAAKNRAIPEGIPQNDADATYSAMLKKEDGLIDWHDTARAIDAKIRAFNPWPGAFTRVRGVQLKIHRAAVYGGELPQQAREALDRGAIPGTVLGVDKKEGILIQTGNGILTAATLQWQTKKAVDWKDFINGSGDFPGTICGTQE